MNLLSEEEIKPRSGFSFAPMIDFLFLMMALFATLAISKATLFDTEVDLVQMKPQKENPVYHNSEKQNINLSISAKGTYKWMTDLNTYTMEDLEAVQKEIIRQYDLGLLPKDKGNTEILLHIDKDAPWDPIAKVIFAIREIGFSAHPIYEPES